MAGSALRAEESCFPLRRLPDCVSTPDTGTTGQTFQPGASQAATDMASLSSRTGGAGIGSSAEFDPGYIDVAAPRTQFRWRGDAFYRDNRPDRADFFYPKCGCFQTPDAKGPPLPEKKVDAQEQTFYFEYAPTERYSGFLEVPYRYINPEVNANASGFGDLRFGFKYAIISSPDQVLSLQLRTFTPTGDPFKGLGTNNWALEPAILYQNQLSERLEVFGEFRDLIPVGAIDDFAGQVLRYGVGAGYLVYNGDHVRVTPIGEFVGWTVLSGKEFAPDIGEKDAAGDTIVNAKIGARFNFGDAAGDGRSFLSRSDFYLGYGRALTGTVWYKDIIRVEYRLRF
jgi:hypothetical protein